MSILNNGAQYPPPQQTLWMEALRAEVVRRLAVVRQLETLISTYWAAHCVQTFQTWRRRASTTGSETVRADKTQSLHAHGPSLDISEYSLLLSIKDCEGYLPQNNCRRHRLHRFQVHPLLFSVIQQKGLTNDTSPGMKWALQTRASLSQQ